MEDGTTVIVADDSELFCGSIARSVRSHPKLRLVGRAGDGRQAFELIRTLSPDVATVDVRMPGLGGEQLLAELAAAGSPTKVLLLSAHIDGRLVNRALAGGAAGCLSKDDREAEVLDAIVAVAAGRTVISPRLQPLLAGHLRGAEAPTGPKLSRRERQILELSSQGNSAKQIAERLFISTETVTTLLRRAAAKLDSHGKTHTVAEAMRRGLL